MEIQEIINNLEGMSVNNDAEITQVRLIKAQVQAIGILVNQLENIADELREIKEYGIGQNKNI
jgi:acetolactate synthase regulatory subunit